MNNELNVPAGLTAVAGGPGVNTIQFARAGGEDILYEIWRRHGDTVDWYLHTSVSNPVFEDTDVTAGQYYEYKVRAASSGEYSDFSESAVVYGK